MQVVLKDLDPRGATFEGPFISDHLDERRAKAIGLAFFDKRKIDEIDLVALVLLDEPADGNTIALDDRIRRIGEHFMMRRGIRTILQL